MLFFTWDPDKGQKNFQKHGISFEEAKTVFDDREALLFDDPDHSENEERFLIIGFSDKGRLCIVSHCYRHEIEIRIISARKANPQEAKIYVKNSGGMS